MRKIVVSTLFGLGLLMGSAYGDEVIIRTRPPHAIVETRIARSCVCQVLQKDFL